MQGPRCTMMPKGRWREDARGRSPRRRRNRSRAPEAHRRRSDSRIPSSLSEPPIAPERDPGPHGDQQATPGPASADRRESGPRPEVPAELVTWKTRLDGQRACVVRFDHAFDELFRESKRLCQWFLGLDGAVSTLFVNAEDSAWPGLPYGQHAEVTCGPFEGLHALGIASSTKARERATALAFTLGALVLRPQAERRL